jgi:hypothetical protein
MPDTSNSTSRFGALARWVLLSIALTTIIWMIVIAWWRATQTVVQTSDLLLYLVALPLGAIGVLLLCVYTYERRKNRRAQSAAAPSSDDHPEAESPPPSLTLPILSTWAVTNLAPASDEVVDTLTERRTRPLPDPLLTDEQGFPLLSGRFPELDASPIEAILNRHTRENQENDFRDVDSYSTGCLRALTLLGLLLDQVLNDWPLRTVDDQQQRHASQAATLRGSSGLAYEADRPFVLDVKLIVSTSLQQHEQAFARAYLKDRLAPLKTHMYDMRIDLVAACDDATGLALADAFSLNPSESAGQALLLLACDSTLCPIVTEDWHASGRLFGSRQPNGLMMGEAAFGILCVRESALDHALKEPVCHLTRMSRARREASADAQGKPSSACLAEQIARALDASRVTGEEIGTVVCDADHRNGRTLECIGAMIEQTPRLDALQNRLALNEACGHLGAASMTGVMSVATLQVATAGHPVLLFNVSHATDRAAAVLIPPDRIDTRLPPEHLQAA